MTTSQTVLSVERLKKYFPIRRGLLRRVVGHVKAVDDVSFKIDRGETLSLVGESGCGKTTTSRCILRAIQPSAGAIQFRTNDGREVDVAGLPRSELRPLRRQMQMIFQDPYSSLNPRMTIADIIGEPLLVNGVGDLAARRKRVAELLTRLAAQRKKLVWQHAGQSWEGVTTGGVSSPAWARARDIGRPLQRDRCFNTQWRAGPAMPIRRD